MPWEEGAMGSTLRLSCGGKIKGWGGGGKYREHRERSGVMLSHEPGCVRKPEAALRPLPSRNDGRKIS